MRPIKFLLYILPLFLLTNFVTSDMKKSSVLICYGKLKPEAIKGYSYVILESKYYLPSNIRVLKSQNEKVYSYISIGEVNANAPHYQLLKKHTLGKNKIWNSFYLNLKSPKTTEALLQIVKEDFEKGYDGLFLDNIDNFTTHGPQKDQKNELIGFLKLLKEMYPNKQFIQNAGLEIIDQTSPYINAVAIESVVSDYSFKTKSYKMRDNSQSEAYMKRIKAVNETYKTPIILIEYADSQKLYKKIEEKVMASNFEYFIGNIDLLNLPNFKP